MIGLVSAGFYPSTPVRPNYALSEDILQLFYDMQMAGSSAKQAFCGAIYALISRKSKVTDNESLPTRETFYKRFLYIYAAWLDVKAIVERKTDIAIAISQHDAGDSADGGIQQDICDVRDDSNPKLSRIRSSWSSGDSPFECLNTPTPLERLCPACFGSEPRPFMAAIVFDGNFSQKRLKVGNEDWLRDYRDRRLFIDKNYSSAQARAVCNS
jgi:hypothetical protein